jgi:hypothetical protein
MADDFLETAQQMMSGAKALQATGAHRNACYLAGYVVECTLKTMLEVAGESPPLKHEVDDLNVLLLRLSLAPGDKIGTYGDPSVLAPMIFRQLRVLETRRDGSTVWRDQCHWDPKHRYDGTRWANDATSRQYIAEAQKFADIIDDMKITFLGIL